jgi:hypothetical protein
MYDSREPFYAMSADSITNSWQPATDWWNYSNTLQGSPGAYIAAANPFAPDVDTLTLDTLGYSYAGPTIGGIVAQSGDFLDEIESGPDAYQSTSQGLYQTSGYADHAYGRAYQGPDGSMWLQYWFWYYYNDGRFDGYFDHEGDWENVQVKLTPNASNTGFAPVSATYAMHTERATCNWSVVPITNGQHPVVYPSFGRHASYFTPDKTINGDQNDALGALVPLAITPIHSYTNWVRWPGRWGSTTRSDIPLYNKLESDSPTGPAQHTQWSDPAGWDGGDSRTDKCPVVGVIISRRGHRRFHSRDYGRGPVIRVRLLRDHRVRVAWRLRTPADRVILSVRSVSTTAPASTDVTRNHWRRRGAMSLQLPHVEGPFAVSGTSVRRHRFSQETVVRVGT